MCHLPPLEKIRSSSSLTNLMSLGGADLRSATLKPKPPTRPSKVEIVSKPMSNQEKAEVKKFEKLWNKTDRILRSRSVSKYKAMSQVCIRGGKKMNLFLVLL